MFFPALVNREQEYQNIQFGSDVGVEQGFRMKTFVLGSLYSVSYAGYNEKTKRSHTSNLPLFNGMSFVVVFCWSFSRAWILSL